MAVHTSEITSASDDGNISFNPNGSGKVVLQDLSGGGERQVGVDNSGAVKPLDTKNLATLPSTTDDSDIVVVQRGGVKYQASANLFGGGGGPGAGDIIWEPRQDGPNASPRLTNCSGKYGVVSGTWSLESVVLECTGAGLFSVNGGAFTTSQTPIDVGDAISITFDETVVNATADAATVSATLQAANGSYKKNFSLVVKREDPNFEIPGLSGRGTSSEETSASAVPSISVPSTVALGTQGATALSSPRISVNGQAYVALTTTPIDINPCDSLQFKGTTGTDASTTYTLVFTLGDEEKTWSVATTGTGAAVAQPSIVSPANDATDVGSLTDGVDLIATAYQALNGAGTHQDSDWETFRFKGNLNRALLSDNIQTVTGQEDGTWNAIAAPLQSWQDITYADGKFVAVSPGGVIYSTDGLSWTSGNPSKVGPWNSVVYGGNKFVAIGNDGNDYRSMYSFDGIDWLASDLPANSNWRGLTYGNGLFVATANSGTDTWKVAYSSDGVSWATVSAPTGNWNSVAYGNGKFVAVSSNNNYGIMWSTDAINWTIVTEPENLNWESVVYGGGKFVAVADGGSGDNRVMWSTDGISWTSAADAEDNAWKHVTYGNGTYVAVAQSGTNRVMWSTDAISWTGAIAAEANSWQSVFYGDGKFVAVSSNGTNRVMWSYTGTGNASSPNLTFTGDKDLKYFDPGDAITQDSSLRTSNITGVATSNGLWTGQTIPGNWGFRSLGLGNNLYVGPGVFADSNGVTTSAAVQTSFDGNSWTSNSLGGGAENMNWLGVAYGNSLWVSVAASSFNSSNVNRVMTSSNGTSWSVVSGLSGDLNLTGWQDVTYGDGKFVAVGLVQGGGSYSTMYSTNGTTWTGNNFSTGSPIEAYGVVYANNKFVVAAGEQIQTSPDGITWTQRSLPGYWNSVAYGNGVFVAVAIGGAKRVAYSTDGESWSYANTASFDSAVWYDVAYTNGSFVAVSDSATAAIYSTDGINWTASAGMSPSFTSSWQTIVAGSDRFVVGGGRGDETPNVMWSKTGTGLNETILALTDDKDLVNFESGDNVYGGPANLTSTNSITGVSVANGEWTAGSTFTGGMSTGQYRSLVYGDGKFVACSINPNSTRIIYSTDGKNWLEASNVITNGYGGVTLGADPNSGNPLWIALAYSGNNNRLIKSSNGINWETGSVSSVVGTKSWTAVTYGGGKFVAVSTDSFGMYSYDGSNWTAMGTPGIGAYRSIAYGGPSGSEKFVAVGQNSGICYSSDGINWTRVSPMSAGRDWQDVYWGGDKWVAVSYTGTYRVAYSFDGISWTDVTTLGALDSGSWQTVTYGPSGFTAVASSGSPHVMNSTDGITWTAGVLESPLTTYAWSSAAYGAGVYAVVSNNSAMWSNNGTGLDVTELSIVGALTDGFIASDVLTTDLAGGSGTITDLTDTSVTTTSSSGFLVGQQIVTSGLTANGTVSSTNPSARTMSLSTSSGRWAKGNPAFGPESTTTGNVNTVTVGSNQMTVNNVNGRFIVGRPVTGPVKELPPPPPSGDVPSSDYALTDRALASSDLETHNLPIYPSGVFSSSNAITNITLNAVGTPWTSTGPINSSSTWNSVAFNESDTGGSAKFVVIGNSSDSQSSDNSDATDWYYSSGGLIVNDDIEDIACDGNGTFVSVGRQGMVNYSTTGDYPWTSYHLGTSYGGSQWVNWGIGFGNGYWVICGDQPGANDIYRSTNGLSWDQITTPFNASNGMLSIATDGANNWVTVGQGGEIGLSSDNGASWTLSPGSNSSYGSGSAVGYGNGVWMAAFKEASTAVLRSVDNGITWSPVASGLLGSRRPTSFAYGNGVWFGTAINGILITSTDDGLNWSTVNTGLGTMDFNKVIYAGEVFVIVGGGLIATAPAGSTTFTIAGCLSDGFVPGDVIDDCGGDAEDSTISFVNDTQVVVPGNPSGWDVGDSICRPGGVTPYSTFFSHVKYRSDDPIDSTWSNWSAFTTGELVPEVGDEFGGGYFMGQILDSGVIYNIIICPIDPANTGRSLLENVTFTSSGTNTYSGNGTTSSNTVWGGPVTADFMNVTSPPTVFNFFSATAPGYGGATDRPNGSNDYDPAKNTPIYDGIGGYSDWYLPSLDELELGYRYLKPTTDENGNIGYGWGTNPNSIPVGAAYTTSNPSQTLVPIFQNTNEQAFKGNAMGQTYWTAFTDNSGSAYYNGQRSQSFVDGNQGPQNASTDTGGFGAQVRPVRRVPA